jgi:hypothetical protein
MTNKTIPMTHQAFEKMQKRATVLKQVIERKIKESQAGIEL